MFNYASLVDIALMLFAWSLGLYVVTRSPRSLVSAAAVGSTFTVALFLYGSGMRANLRDPVEWQIWGGTLWWAASLAPAVWYLVSAAVLRRESDTVPAWYRRTVAYPMGLMLVAAGIGFGVAAQAGDSIFRWSAPTAVADAGAFESSWNALPGWLFPWAGLYIVIAMIVPLFHFGWVWRRVPRGTRTRPQLRWLTVAAILLAVSGVWSVLDALTDEGLPYIAQFVPPSRLILAAGLGLLAWTVVRHGTWIDGEPVRGDFAYFLAGLGTVVTLYTVVIAVIGVTFDLRGLVLMFSLGLLILTTHALADVGRLSLGRLFFPDAWPAQALFLRFARQAGVARDHTAVLRQAADASDERWWYEQTERTLRRLRNPAALAEEEIAARLAARGATPLDRARETGDIVVSCIDKLDPGDGRPPPRLFFILRESYVEGKTTREIMNRHQIPEKTYYNERKLGVAALAAELRALGQA